MSNGVCYECLQRDLHSAPRNCVRCAMEEAYADDHVVLEWAEIVRLHQRREWTPADLWTEVLHHREQGFQRPNRFYLYASGHVGHSRLRLVDDHHDGQYDTAWAAQRAAELRRYRSTEVWVVTYLGAWNADQIPF